MPPTIADCSSPPEPASITERRSTPSIPERMQSDVSTLRGPVSPISPVRNNRVRDSSSRQLMNWACSLGVARVGSEKICSSRSVSRDSGEAGEFTVRQFGGDRNRVIQDQRSQLAGNRRRLLDRGSCGGRLSRLRRRYRGFRRRCIRRHLSGRRLRHRGRLLGSRRHRSVSWLGSIRWFRGGRWLRHGCWFWHRRVCRCLGGVFPATGQHCHQRDQSHKIEYF